MKNRAQKFKPLTISRAQYAREHRALSSELFYRQHSAFRPDIEGALAHLPETWGCGFEEAAGFYTFIWRNAAAFIDIAGAFTRRLRGTARVRALWAILVTAWRMHRAFDPMVGAARPWFRRVCMTAMKEF